MRIIAEMKKAMRGLEEQAQRIDMERGTSSHAAQSLVKRAAYVSGRMDQLDIDIDMVSDLKSEPEDENGSSEANYIRWKNKREGEVR